MHAREYLLRALLLVAAATLVLIGYYGYLRYELFQGQMAINAMETQQILANRTNTVAALAQAGVDPQQSTRGFWYITTDAAGNQSVAYFDLDLWSLRPDISSSTIAGLAAEVASSSIVDRDSMHAVPESQLPPDLQFHNQLYSGQLQPGQFANTQSTLEQLYASGKATSDQLWQLAYLYELQGDYAKRDELNAANCKLYKQRCAGTIPVTLSGTVVDEAGRPVQGAHVSVLSHPEVASTTTDVNGTYAIKLSVLPMEKVRVSAVKRNYTDGVASAIVLTPGKSSYALPQIQLTSPIIIVTIDTKNHTVSDPRDTANSDGSFVLHATSSTYAIPPGAIVHRDGSAYLGPVDVYIYEFTRDTVPQSLVMLDTFDSVLGYAGNLMQTLGMPYIQFFTPSGEELDVRQSNPMLLTYKIPGMQDMLDNYYNRPQGPLTNDQVQELLAASQGDPGFPITSQWLADHKISTFAAFWVFDHVKGTWENQGMRLLDAEGTMQAPFYTTTN